MTAPTGTRDTLTKLTNPSPVTRAIYMVNLGATLGTILSLLADDPAGQALKYWVLVVIASLYPLWEDLRNTDPPVTEPYTPYVPAAEPDDDQATL